MPVENARIMKIVLEEVETVEDRCLGYKEEVKETLAEIIMAEYQHRQQKTRIQQIVNDKCDLAGQFLAERRRRAGK